MSDSSKRRGPFRGFFTKASGTPRGQKAIRAAIEGLESRVLMSVTAVNYEVTTDVGSVGTLPTAPPSGTILTDTLTDAVAAANQIAAAPIAGNTYAVSITFQIGTTVAADTIAPSTPLVLDNTDGAVSSWTINGPITGTFHRPITISGAGMNSSGSIFTVVNGATATFSNLTFTGEAVAGAPTDGGAINSSINNLTISGDKFNNNSALTSGGAVYDNGGGTLTVTTSTFTSDSAGTSGGAIYSTATTNSFSGTVFGGAITVPSLADTVTGASGQGGAVYFGATTVSGLVTGATNAAPIVITTATNPITLGMTNGSPVTISGVSGNTAANGTFFAGSVTATTFKLYADPTLLVPIVGNGAYESGGTWTGPTLASTTSTLNASNFIDDTANGGSGQGGALFSAGGKLIIGTTTTENSFNGDSATGGSGGAIYSQDTTLLSVGHTNFGALGTTTLTGIDTATTGGAVYATGAPAATFTSDIFTNDRATTNGGGLYNLDTALTISSTSFGSATLPDTAVTGGALWTNNAGASLLTSDTFTSDTASTNGGAIYTGALSTSTTINTTSFVGNKATAAAADLTDGNGGAIYSLGTAGSTLTLGTTAATHDLFSSNLATNTNASATGGNGGAVYATEAILGVVGAYGSSTTANKATNSGGAIYYDSPTTASLTVTGSTFFFDTAGNATAGGSGGAIYDAGAASGSTASIGTTSFTSDTAYHSGGAVDSVGGTGSSLTLLAGDAFATNVATAYNGGAINSNDASLTVNGGTFTTNKAVNTGGGGGGAIYTTATTIQILAVGTVKPTFNTNSAYAYGGAIAALGVNPSLTVTGGSFTSDTAISPPVTLSTVGSGGAIYDGGGTGALAITGSAFITNSAKAYGGAIFSTGGVGSLLTLGDATIGVTLTHDTFTGNLALAGSGGAVYSGDTTVNDTNSIYSGNKATGVVSGPAGPNAPVPGTGLGGGIYSISGNGTVNITGDTFSTDSASFGGGGLFFSGSVGNVSGSTFTSDTVAYITVAADNIAFGGGICSESSSHMTVDTSTFTLDTATELGGGIYSNDPTLNVTNSLFGALTATATTGGDTALVGGGGIAYARGGGTVNVSGTTFRHNAANNTTTAGDPGGAIEVGVPNSIEAAALNASNDTFSGNTATNAGAGIYTNANSVSITGSTFTANIAAKDFGGGLFVDSGTVSGSVIGASSATPIVITTASTTSLVNGEAVTISGVVGNATANGNFFIGNVTSTGFSLYSDAGLTTPVVGSGTSTANTGTWAAGSSNLSNLEVYNSLFNGNSAKVGGGIFFGGQQAAIADDTFYKNVATGETISSVSYGGGGLAFSGTGATAALQSVVTDSTFASNSATLPKSGAGIDGYGAYKLLLQGDIVAQNTTGTTTTLHNDLAGYFDSASSYNIIGDGLGTSQNQIQSVPNGTGINNGVNNNIVGGNTSGTVVAGTASTGQPIVIHTTSTTGLANGQRVTVAGETADTNANGTFYVAALTSTSFELSTTPVVVTTVTGNGTSNAGTWTNILSPTQVFGSTGIVAPAGPTVPPSATGQLGLSTGSLALGNNDSAGFVLTQDTSPLIAGTLSIQSVIGTDQDGVTRNNPDDIGSWE